MDDILMLLCEILYRRRKITENLGLFKTENVGPKKLLFSNMKELELLKKCSYLWWHRIFECPANKMFSARSILRYYDIPPPRGRPKKKFVKPYGPPGQGGIPTYKDPEWLTSLEEVKKAQSLEKDDRKNLLVEMIPSDQEDELEAMETDEDDSDHSKENVNVNISKNKSDKKSKKSSEPEKKRRRIILHSGSEESGDEFNPGKNEESSDDESSGTDSEDMSDLGSDSENDSPVKKQKNNKRKQPGSDKPKQSGSNKLANKFTFSVKSTPSSNKDSLSASPAPSKTPIRTPSTPKVSENTKSKLSLFSAKDTPTKTKEDGEGDWAHTRLAWLKPDAIRDIERKRPDHPEYNPRTLFVPDDHRNSSTPGMRQWWDLKMNHFDTVLFFKVGKFYELYHMDAVTGVNELGLTYMKGDFAHSGFPEIAYGRFSANLLDKGYKVARVEQVETPDMMEKRCKQMARPTKFDKALKREVCQVSSKGTRVYGVLDGEATESSSQYLFAITERRLEGAGEGRQYGVAFIDTSIGTFHLGQFDDDRYASRLRTLMSHYPPAQILYEKGKLSPKTLKMGTASVSPNLLEGLSSEKEFWTAQKTLGFLADGTYFQNDKKEFHWPEALKNMLDDSDTLGRSSKSEYELCVSALGAVVWYLMDCYLEEQLLTRQNFEIYSPLDGHLQEKQGEIPAFIKGRNHMILDGSTLSNLEVFENTDGGYNGTLLDKLDHCSTVFGKRLLRKWICTPLCNPDAINSRLDALEDLRENPDVVEEVTKLLKTLPDLERLLAKIHTVGLKRNKNHPDERAVLYEEQQYSKRKVVDFLSAVDGFKTTISVVRAFKNVAGGLKSTLLRQCVSTTENSGKFPILKEVLNFFDNAFDQSEAKKEGKIIPSKGVDPEYDESLEKIKEINQRLNEYLKEQCKYFGTQVKYTGNNKNRYQIEVPDHASRKADDDYELQGQRKGFKRFWTEETKAMFYEMTQAEDTRDQSLRDIARRIFKQFDDHQESWQSALECLSSLDVLMSLTRYSLHGDTIRPNIVLPENDIQPFIDIRDGRHPCAVTSSGDDFIPNDVTFGATDEESHAPLVLVTGPNMGGKSTLMRQTGLICLLAQLGCFVPAGSCNLTPIDRVFTRLGAQDRIMSGESTFYVELAETSAIIQHASKHSLVLVDELGRGTATYDGTAIASAVVHALVQLSCRTLFSTHYHSLVDDFTNAKEVSLGHMACMVENENEEDPTQETITFLYKFAGGSCPKSYGFNAARLAELPEIVIRKGSQKARTMEISNIKKKAFSKLFGDKNMNGIESIKEAVRNIRNV
ncbi:unnamed protein product, partial [Meganyctiphanes norvegica]